MSANVQALLWVLGCCAVALAALAPIAMAFDDNTPDVRHPYREDIPDWW